jgi:hypothetical protein
MLSILLERSRRERERKAKKPFVFSSMRKKKKARCKSYMYICQHCSNEIESSSLMWVQENLLGLVARVEEAISM